MIARIRTVKPALFLHGLLFDLEQRTQLPIRLSYIGLWCWTDREGRFEWKPRELKQGIAPYDAVDFGHVLNVLANTGFVVRYMVDGREYGWVPRFLDHQNLNGREVASTLPPPPAEALRLKEDGLVKASFHALTREQLVAEADVATVSVSASWRNDLQDSSRVVDASGTRGSRDTLGREGKGREGKTSVEQERAAQRATNGNGHGSTLSDVETLSDAGERSDDARVGGAGSNQSDAPLDANANGSARAAEPENDLPPAHGGAAVVVHDGARNVPALPAVRGERNAGALRERLATVFGEIAAGSRTRLKREQFTRLQAELVFLYWTAKFEHPGAVLDQKREAVIVKRLKENGGDVSELMYALDGAFHDDWVMGRDERSGGTRRDRITFLLRDRDQVEQFANTRKGYREKREHRALAELQRAVDGAKDGDA